MNSIQDNKGIGGIAARWVARLDRGDLSADELIELRDWATASPAHMHALERMADVWESLDALAALRKLVARPAGPARSLRNLAVAASIGLMALVAWLIAASIVFPPPVEVTESFVTDVGEQRSIEPGEGSKINLNTDSEMEVDYSASQRMVRLTRGEAFFDVEPGDDRPFVVETPYGDVVVTGTMFLVRVDDSGLEVMVKEGHVELHDTPGEVAAGKPEVAELEAGEIAIVDEIGDRQISNIESEELVRKLGWRDGMLMFNGESLEEVVREVGRYTPIKIVIDDQALREQRIGGYFKVGEIDDLLGTLQNDFDIDVERVHDTEVRLTARNK